MKKSSVVNKKIGGHVITISHPDKLLFPGITKLEVIDYYDKISGHMLPYLKNRAIMMQRWPNGVFGDFFYQKDISDYFPKWIKNIPIAKQDGHTNYVICQNKATLIYLANQACITFHLWLSRTDKLNYPDRLIFDLDPSDKSFTKVRSVALLLKQLLDILSLKSFVMTTGSHGAHVVVPLKRYYTFEQVKQFADSCAQIILQEHPELVTLELRKNKRGKKLFIDTLRNQFGATAVSPYSIRAYKEAPVATPLSWKELESNTKLYSQSYTMTNIFARLTTIPDPWETFSKSYQSLTKAQRLLATYNNNKKT